MGQYLASAVFASNEIVSITWNKTLGVFRSLALRSRDGISIDGQTAETKPFSENSTSLTVKRFEGLSDLTNFTARRKQSWISSKSGSADLKASLHVSNYAHYKVNLSFKTFA